jgi:ParB family transcriptional regulator, chromosome partitioning protein
MSRKDTLRAMLTARDRQLPVGNFSPPAGESLAPKQHIRSGAVGAMGRSLGKIASAAEEARALIGSGIAIVELDPALVESSFVSDRLDGSPEDHRALMDSISEHGQQVPILVRPHPTDVGRYQVAYGHRRLRAVHELGRKVRAIVKSLNDAELVVAQGQENSARLNLSYIEKAMFAVVLEDRGFDRSVLMAALSLEKTQLSRIISIGRAIPRPVVDAIGPAPRTGRPRWAALADILVDRDWHSTLKNLRTDSNFLQADSDARFAMFDAHVRQKFVAPTALETWNDPEGRRAAAIKRAGTKLTLIVDQKIAPDFGEFIVAELQELYRRYAASKMPG